MNNNISSITNSLEYYDRNNEKYHNLIKKIKYVQFIYSDSDLSYNNILMFDKNKNEIFRSRYEVIGLFNKASNIWSWAWSIPRFKKNDTNIIRQIWNYGAKLDPELEFLKMEITSSRFRIADMVQLDIHVAFASYLSKQPFVYKYYLYVDNTKKEQHLKDKYHDVNIKTDNYVIYYLFLLDNKLNSDDIDNDEDSINQTESL